MKFKKKDLSLEPVKLNEDKTKKEFASEDCQTLLALWEEYYPKVGYNLPWVGYFVKHNNTIVGSCAFTGSPVNKKVELSYWTFKEFEGKGISTNSCRQLISIAKNNDPNITITAKTAPEKNASTTILEHNGFVFSGVVQDHEIEDAWEWVLKN